MNNNSEIRIVCTIQIPFGNPPQCARIWKVGVSNGAYEFQEEWTVAKVVELMKCGYTFYTYGQTSWKKAQVHYYYCSKCMAYHIRSAADAVTDNNLDSLPCCPMKRAA